MLTDLPVRSGYEWYVYGRNLVLAAVSTGIIADVLFDVFE
jgi:Ni/Co efflux regulator RcnB